MKPITAIVLGAGSRGSIYAGYAKEHPDELRIVALGEPREDRRDMLADSLGLGQEARFATWQELLNLPRMADCAFVCTLDDDHTAPGRKMLWWNCKEPR